jgi:iron complex outermembrane recepter protein
MKNGFNYQGKEVEVRAESFGRAGVVAQGVFLGESDRKWTSTNAFGGSLQAIGDGQASGHGSHIVVGLSVDHGRSNSTGTSELGTIAQNLFVSGVGVFIGNPSSGISPVSALAFNTYTGLYATDTFEITPWLGTQRLWAGSALGAEPL